MKGCDHVAVCHESAPRNDEGAIVDGVCRLRIDASKAAGECNSGCRKKGRARDRVYRESKADSDDGTNRRLARHDVSIRGHLAMF